MKGEFSNRLVQVSLFSALVYYITAYPVVFEKARKYFPIKFKKTHHLLIFHTFVFAVLMYVLTYFVFDPLVKVVEGKDDGETDESEQTKKTDSKIINMKENENWSYAVLNTDPDETRLCTKKDNILDCGVNTILSKCSDDYPETVCQDINDAESYKDRDSGITSMNCPGNIQDEGFSTSTTYNTDKTVNTSLQYELYSCIYEN